MENDKGLTDCVFLLVHYCEELVADRLALAGLIKNITAPAVRAERSRARLENQKKMEPLFHTFHALLSKKDWPALQKCVQQALDKQLEQ